MTNAKGMYLGFLLCLWGTAALAQDLTVTKITPAHGSTGVPVLTQIIVEFSKPLDKSGMKNYPESGLPVIYDLRPETTELETAFESLSNDGTRLIIAGVRLKPNTQYSLIVSAAIGADGSTLARPAFSTFTTGNSLASGTISGALDSDNIPRKGTIVGAFLNSLLDETQFAGYGIADENGNYEINYLPAGSYQVLAVQDLNNDGNFSLEAGDAFGGYDANNDKLIDPVSLGDGESKSGISFVIFKPTSKTARELYNLVNPVAQNVAKAADPTLLSDAGLVLVVSTELDLTGKSPIWSYIFYSSSKDTSFGFIATDNLIIPGPIVPEEDTTFVDTLKTPLPENWMDSNAAFQIAQDNGGSEFLQDAVTPTILALGGVFDPDSIFQMESPSTTPLAKIRPSITSLSLARGPFSIFSLDPDQHAFSLSGSTPAPYWLFLYTKAVEGQQLGLGFFVIAVNMLTGDYLILTPSFSYALAGLTFATNYIQQFYTDAVLVGIGAPLFIGQLRPDGQALFWIYTFWSALANQFIELMVSSNRVWDFQMVDDFPSKKALPSTFVNSDTAMEKAEAAGGAAFRQNLPYVLMQMLLAYGIYPQDPNRLVWHVQYLNPANPQDPGLNIYVDATTGDVIVGVEDHPVQGPASFELQPVYPNPWQSGHPLNLAYQLREPAQVEIKLYNVLGQEVETLFAGRKMQGNHRLSIPELRSRLAPGVYYIRLRASTASGKIHVLSRPMVIR